MFEGAEQDQLDKIVVGLLSGDAGVHRRLRDQIRQYVRRRYGSDQAGHEDLVSEILHAVYVNLRAGRFRGNDLGTFSAYICGIARLQVRQAIKRAERTTSRHHDSNVEEIPNADPRGADDHVAHQDLIDKIFGALEGECRELLILKFHDGWSDAEIAEHKKKSKNAVSTAISRCVKKVKSFSFVKEFLY
jgi:RNA polymerase sigma factor (sigma-70 family)